MPTPFAMHQKYTQTQDKQQNRPCGPWLRPVTGPGGRGDPVTYRVDWPGAGGPSALGLVMRSRCRPPF